MARYELLERIGVGQMAEIFRGTAIAGSGFEKPVAIKRILPHLSEDQRFIKLLIAEAKILSELQHRNIVQIYDVGLGDDGQYFLVMEFVEGTNLKQVYEHLFNGRRLPVEVALHICSEICEALEHAHVTKGSDGVALGLVHRDVSPSNVLLSKSGEVKLTDFGIAKRAEEVTGHGGVRGKFAYISPEQALNQPVDARSDVYSVGILLYELACGQRLFSGVGDFDALRAVRLGRIQPSAERITGVAPELAQIIMRALSKNADERFPSAGEFGSALRGYRYSLDTNIADPGSEIASLVLREGKAPETLGPEFEESFSLDEQGSKVVRIDTAAEFSLTDLSGLHQVVNTFPKPRIGTGTGGLEFEDMETATVSAKGMAAMLAEPESTDTHTLNFDPPGDEPTELHVRPDLLLREAPPQPSVPSVQPLPGVADPSESTRSRFRRGQPARGRASNPPPNGSDARHPSALAPTGQAPGSVPEQHYPQYSAVASSQRLAENRRKLHMGFIGAAFAVLAFVMLGQLVDDPIVAGADEGDAGVSDALIALDAGILDSSDASLDSQDAASGSSASSNARQRKARLRNARLRKARLRKARLRKARLRKARERKARERKKKKPR